MNTVSKPNGVTVIGAVSDTFEQILTKDALSFIATLARQFESRRIELLDARKRIQADIDSGRLPGFLPETKEIRESDWTINPVPSDLKDRRVEVTGPVERKMVINALNSGANSFMADFEDSHAPTWKGTIQGQINLKDAVNNTIDFKNPEGKLYRLGEKTATLIVRPRGWHLIEKHILVDGKPVSASIFDFGLYLFHNAHTLINKGTGPYFYLPKMESYLEARLWNDIFLRAQDYLDIPKGTIKATVLIETILAAFQMDEIIYELKAHMAGLNCGRWDYIFSFIKRFKNVPGYLFPDRSLITMTRHCMRSYSLLAIKTCHRRGAHAIGGMAAQIPIKNNPEANEAAFQKVKEDKKREARDGHDGTWVAHPGLVPVALEQFNHVMPSENQIHKQLNEVTISADDLLKVPEGPITEKGLRSNISIGIQYMAAWLSGNGCVPLYNLMEDAATAEISRTQIWQWVHHPDAKLDDGREITLELFRMLMTEEMGKIKEEVGNHVFENKNYLKASRLLEDIIINNELEDFLTLRAYEHLD